MTSHYVLYGVLLMLAGAALVHLASPHQRWRVRALPAGLAGGLGALLLGLGLLAFMQVMLVLAALFAFMTWLMVLWVLLPHAGALWSLRRGA